MKEITSVAFNFLAQLHKEGPPTPDVEVALILSEISYDIGSMGQLVKARRPETVRFAASPKTLRDVAKILTEAAEECEHLMATSLREAQEKGGAS